MVDVARLKLELAGLATDAQRCRKEVREATHNGDVSYRYYACQLAEGHVGACDVAGRNLLMWPGYEVMAALLDEVEEHREEAMIRRAVLTIPEVYASVVSQAVADEVVKITAVCTVCGEPATRTQRIAENSDRILLGSHGTYEARCRMHWSSMKEGAL